jgi:DNA-directed RNA polymerase specialized sigma24 family protein
MRRPKGGPKVGHPLSCGRAPKALVRPVGRYYNPRRAVKRLVTAWEQGILDAADDADGADDPLIDACREPVGRATTRLPESRVVELRTLAAQGVGPVELARRFGVHRSTVWKYTRG